MDLALGLIETKGLVGAIEAADAMVKAADVKIISKEKVTGALIIIKVVGETAAVKSSVDAGTAAAQRVGELVSAHVIPRPDDQIDQLLYDYTVSSKKNKEPKLDKTAKTIVPTPSKKEVAKVVKSTKKVEVRKKSSRTSSDKNIDIKDKPLTSVSKKNKIEPEQKIPAMDQLVILNVHALRRIARGFENFPIKGREISKANRAKLLDYFKTLQ